VLSVVDVPLCIDSNEPKILEAGLRLAPGKPLVNSVNGEEKQLPRFQLRACLFDISQTDGDELPEPQDVRIEVELNGKPAMTAHTSDMICGVRDHIRFLSHVLTLRPGDLITTGTPAGVAKLAPGDKLRGRIEHIGEMTLSVAAEAH